MFCNSGIPVYCSIRFSLLSNIVNNLSGYDKTSLLLSDYIRTLVSRGKVL